MKIIKDITDMIEDELEGAENYAKSALLQKDERPDVAMTFHTIATQEMNHVDMLHKAVADIITKYRAEHGEPPAEMQAVYNYLHGKYIDKAVEIKNMLSMFR